MATSVRKRPSDDVLVSNKKRPELDLRCDEKEENIEFHNGLIKLEGYTSGPRIDAGAYGEVFRLTRDHDRAQFVVKRRKCSKDYDSQLSMLSEYFILNRLKGQPHIINLEDFYCCNTHFYYVFPFCPFNLGTAILNKMLDNPKRLRIMQQLLQAVNTAHNMKIIHRDIKPTNIMMKESANEINALLIDWGSSIEFIERVPNLQEVTTLPYRAYELLRGVSVYTKMIDIWSLGIVFVEMFLGKYAIHNGTKDQPVADIFQRIANLLGKPPRGQEMPCQVNFEHGDQGNLREILHHANTPPDVVHLILNMLQYDPAQRISAADAMKHKCFQNQQNVFAQEPQMVFEAPREPI